MITHSDYDYLKSKIDKNESFSFEKISNDKTLRVCGSCAGVDFYSGKTKEGDYILLFGVSDKIGGHGHPIEQWEFNSFIDTYDNFCYYLSKYEIEIEKTVQLSLF